MVKVFAMLFCFFVVGGHRGTVGEADAFPRFNFRPYRMKKHALLDPTTPLFYPKTYAWQFPPPFESYKDLENLAEKFREFQEVIDYEKAQLGKIQEEENLARMYPKDEEEEEFGRMEEEEEKDEMEMGMEEGQVEDEQGRFRDVKIMTNPEDFAYSPNDGRFYSKPRAVQETEVKTTNPVREQLAEPIPTQPPQQFQEVIQKNELKKSSGEVTNGRESTTGKEMEKLREDIPMLEKEAEVIAIKSNGLSEDSAGVYIIAVVAGISAAATVGLIAVGIGWYNLQKHVKNSSGSDYPAYGVTGPNKDISPTGDRRLAQSAQMYHYQHQKQQIIAMERVQPSFTLSRAQPSDRHGSLSEAESEEENEEGDYTVYECPGLAPTGEMEVKNPLFHDDTTPAQTPANSQQKSNDNGEPKK